MFGGVEKTMGNNDKLIRPISSQSPVLDSALRRQLLMGLACGFVLPVVRAGGLGSDIVDVRVWPARDYTRVTLEHTNTLKFSHFTIADPNRLVVDIDGADLNTALSDLVKKVIPNDPYIAGVRIAQNKPKLVRLVFDLKEAVNPQVFQLEPVADYKHRLVFDLYPVKLPADILAGFDTPDELPSKPDIMKALEGKTTTAQFSESKRTENNIDVQAKKADDKKNDDKKSIDQKVEQKKLAPHKGDKTVTPSRPLIIALDPGHGGEDPGAIGAMGTQEKKVVLDIAKRLKAQIDLIPSMHAVLTRDGDYFVPLHRRVEKARRVKADLFVSIHADAFIRPEARGSSVFALSEKGASSAAARWLANNENAADLVGGINIAQQDVQLARVLFDLSTTAQITDSLKVGAAVLKEIGRLNKLHKDQVEQAGFAVLKAPDIPSILVETAFISNPEEEKRLTDQVYQDQMAKAIVGGIQQFFASRTHSRTPNV